MTWDEYCLPRSRARRLAVDLETSQAGAPKHRRHGKAPSRIASKRAKRNYNIEVTAGLMISTAIPEGILSGMAIAAAIQEALQ